MITLLILLQIADVLTTHYVLKKGIGYEANPFLAKLFDKYGHERVLLTIKGAFIVFLLVMAPYIVASPYANLLWGLVAFYVWVVWNNARIIFDKGTK